MNKKTTAPVKLERSLNLTLLVFYGLGTTIGAGIYVLVGAAAGVAGMFAPLAFVIAAIGLIPTAMSFAEWSGRIPVSAGEAAYVNSGFNSRNLSIFTGWMAILSGLVASATISIGCAGYLSTFVNVPIPYLIIGVILLMGLVAIWGIMESVMLAAFFTIIEAGGLIVLIYFGFSSELVDLSQLANMNSSFGDGAIWIAILNASLLGVFAFIGFQDIVNVVEETKNPRRTIPLAIFLTLGITTVLYALVTVVAILTVPPEELALSEAPLSLVFQKLTGASPLYISAVAVFATANTILIQFIVVSRIVYGMAKQGTMVKRFSKVNAKTKTPLLATVFVVIITIVLALTFPLEKLAEWTSQVILIIWTLVNLALVRIKMREGNETGGEGFVAPIWVPIVGAIFCAGLVIVSFWF